VFARSPSPSLAVPFGAGDTEFFVIAKASSRVMLSDATRLVGLTNSGDSLTEKGA